MTQDPGPTPPTQPLRASDDATRVRPDSAGDTRTHPDDPPRRGQLRFYSGVACGSLLLALVIGIGGFLGLRQLGGESGPAPAASSTAAGSGDEGTQPGQSGGGSPEVGAADGTDEADGADDGREADDGTDMPEIPTGAQDAQPAGTTVPFDASDSQGYLEVTFGEVVWDADAVIAEANIFNDPAAEDNRYLMVTLEASYRGSGSFTAYVWAKFEYVAEDGTVHPHRRIVTPNHVSGGHGQIRDGEDFTEEIVFEVPADAPEGGQFVIADPSAATEEGTWVDAV